MFVEVSESFDRVRARLGSCFGMPLENTDVFR
jgi:hypothetical protein